MKRKLIIAVVLAGILYLADFLSVRFRIPARNSVGTVTVHTYYVVKLKNGRTEYDPTGPQGDQNVNCSNSILPQFGLKPCWYVRRHTDQQINIDSGTPNNPTSSLFVSPTRASSRMERVASSDLLGSQGVMPDGFSNERIAKSE